MTFDEYVLAHERRLLAFAMTLTFDRRLAEDVLQDVLARAFVRWETISAVEQPHAYVRRMVVNEYISFRRRWARHEPQRQPIELDLVVDDPSGAHADRAALFHEMAKLPRRQRAVLALRFYEDLPDTEIARLMHCSTATVRSYVSRALAKLRVQIADTERRATGRLTPEEGSS
ncbi:MAG TPA: SigE family RNA polymerase sigma factor [Jatrophihabitantaceae bacterium]|jgi:RNA polymerase sigma-70 factor (sigma-E family)